MRFESAQLRKLTKVLGIAALAASCATVPVRPPVDPPPPPIVDTFNVAAVVTDAFSHRPIAGASCTLTGQTLQTNSDGYALLLHILGGPRVEQTLGCAKEGYRPAAHTFVNDHDQNVAVVLEAEHVDPSGIPLEQLAAIRGAMWPDGPASTCGGLPYGPRPSEADNIIATGFFANYSADQQLCIVTELRARGYTHVVMGPIVDSDGYHGQYAPHDWHWEDAAHLTGDNFDKFLDIAQYFWDHGLAPIVFIHPDGWTLDQTRDTFTPLLQLPRAQKLLRIVVPLGWEPGRYDHSSCTWALYAQWARQLLPNALVLIHTVNDVDAPAGTDDLCNDDDLAWNPAGNAGAWQRVAPFIHGWLIQNGAYKTAPAADPQLATNFCAQFQVDGNGAQQHSIAWHFAGHAGWPTTSAFGDRPPLLYNGEVTAYEGYWGHEPEATRVQWGDLAMRCGAAGYLDGGTVPVPVPR